MKRRALMISLAIGLSLTNAAARAHVISGPCGTDEHVQCAVYDPNEVYQITTAPGRATMIQFEAGEAIEERGAGMGDGKAWSASSNKNWVLIKPAAARPDTNFMVVTNRRSYTFSLVTARSKDPTTWLLKFDYPDTRVRVAAEESKKRARLSDAVTEMARVSAAAPTYKNEAYSMRGNEALAPSAAWDDGRFTFFRYGTSRDLPHIFTIRADGSEALTNYHMDGDTVIVQARWMNR